MGWKIQTHKGAIWNIKEPNEPEFAVRVLAFVKVKSRRSRLCQSLWGFAGLALRRLVACVKVSRPFTNMMTYYTCSYVLHNHARNRPRAVWGVFWYVVIPCWLSKTPNRCWAFSVQAMPNLPRSIFVPTAAWAAGMALDDEGIRPRTRPLNRGEGSRSTVLSAVTVERQVFYEGHVQ